MADVKVTPVEGKDGVSLHETTGKTASAYGRKFKAIEFPFSWEGFVTDEAFVNANPSQLLTIKEQREYRNNESMTKARTAAQSKAWTDNGIKPLTAKDPQFRFMNTFNMLMANAEEAGETLSVKDAREQTAKFLKIDWQEEWQ